MLTGKIVVMLILVSVLGVGVFAGVKYRAQNSQPNINQSASSVTEEIIEEATPAPSSSPQTAAKKVSPTTSIAPAVINSVEISTDKKSGETTVEITEDTLNAQLSRSLAGKTLGDTPAGEATISEISVKIDTGVINIAGSAKAGFLTLPFKIDATIDLVNKKPKVNLKNMSLNGIPLPEVVANSLEGSIQGEVDSLIGGYNFELVAIKLEPKKIVIVGKTN